MPEIDETTLELPLLFGFAVKNKPLSSLALISTWCGAYCNLLTAHVTNEPHVSPIVRDILRIAHTHRWPGDLFIAQSTK